MIEEGIKHEGFALINVFSPCVTFNKINTYDWFKENIVDLAEFEDYDPIEPRHGHEQNYGNERSVDRTDLSRQIRKSYENLLPGFKEEGLASQDLKLTKEQFDNLVAEFK